MKNQARSYAIILTEQNGSSSEILQHDAKNYFALFFVKS